jgi:signal transduction histidine kinase
MAGSPGKRRLPTNNVVVTTATAVLLLTAVLFWLQYRSLQQLRCRTRIVAQDQVRQGLEILQQRLEEQIATIASDSLARIDTGDLAAGNLNATSVKFQAILKRHSVVGHIFAVSECACAGEPYAVLSANGGAEWVKCSRFTEPVIAEALRAHRAARGLPKDGEFADVLYFQSGLRAAIYAFRYLPGATANGSWSNLGIRNPKDSGRWAGLEIQTDALLREVAPTVLAGLKRHGSESNGELAVTVSESGRGAVFSTAKDVTASEATIQAGPLLPLWTLSGRHQGTTIESLAQAQFRSSMAVSTVVFCSLMLAIGLSLRAVARETKLAELKSGFVSNVSHEMKTPLALIRVFAETLELGRVTEQPRLQEYYRVIHSESRRLTQLIDRVLDFASMEAGRRRYQFESTDLARLVSDAVKPYVDQIRSQGFALDLQIEQALPPALVDAQTISQAVTNLIDNALKYSNQVKEIRVRVYRAENQIGIEVADKGIGIPDSEQRRVFDKFYRVNNSLVHETKGSGLGLSLTKSIVEAHHGRIDLDSRPGGGSRFTILLPACTAANDEQTQRALAGERFAEAPHH